MLLGEVWQNKNNWSGKETEPVSCSSPNCCSDAHPTIACSRGHDLVCKQLKSGHEKIQKTQYW